MNNLTDTNQASEILQGDCLELNKKQLEAEL